MSTEIGVDLSKEALWCPLGQRKEVLLAIKDKGLKKKSAVQPGAVSYWLKNIYEAFIFISTPLDLWL